jgi:hypothetical protein
MVYQHRSRQNEAFEPRRNRPGGPLLAAPSQGVGTRLIAQWALPFAPPSRAAISAPFSICHPERNFVIGKANDKVESKDPYGLSTPLAAKRGVRTAPQSPGWPTPCGTIARVGTRLIAQWALPFTPRVPEMSVRKIKNLTSGRANRSLTIPAVRRATSQEARNRRLQGSRHTFFH